MQTKTQVLLLLWYAPPFPRNVGVVRAPNNSPQILLVVDDDQLQPLKRVKY